jgi:hypothetical protein
MIETQLDITNKWLAVSLEIKNLKTLIARKPTNQQLIRLQEAEKEEIKLKAKMDSFKQKQEEVQQIREDVGPCEF